MITRKPIYLACICSILAVTASTQNPIPTTKDSLNYFRYTNEFNVGLPVFGISPSLTYKVRIPEIKYVTYNRKNAARFMFSADLTTTRDEDTSVLGMANYNTSPFYYNLNPLTFPGSFSYAPLKSAFVLFASAGFEQQFQKERFHLSYGFDAGWIYRSKNYYDLHIWESDTGGISILKSYYSLSERYNGPFLTPFAGFKFFISQRFSVGVESGIQFSWLNINLESSYYEDLEEVYTQQTEIRYFDINTMYIRSLAASFYF